MARHFFFLTCSLALSALAGGLEQPQPGGVDVNAVPLGRVVDVQRVEGVPVNESQGAFFNFPAHTRLVLNRPGERWRANDPSEQPSAYLALYPLAALLKLFPDQQPDTMGHEVAQRLNVLKSVQATGFQAGQLRQPLPYFPVPNAFQAVSGAVRVIETPTFKGIRYLTVHSQESGVRLAREAVEYTFQGLSKDGKTLISMHAPYRIASLPGRAELDSKKAWALAPYPGKLDSPEGRAYQKRNADYLAGLHRIFNAQDAALQMKALDATLRSLRLQ